MNDAVLVRIAYRVTNGAKQGDAGTDVLLPNIRQRRLTLEPHSFSGTPFTSSIARNGCPSAAVPDSIQSGDARMRQPAQRFHLAQTTAGSDRWHSGRPGSVEPAPRVLLLGLVDHAHPALKALDRCSCRSSRQSIATNSWLLPRPRPPHARRPRPAPPPLHRTEAAIPLAAGESESPAHASSRECCRSAPPSASAPW